MEENPNKLHMIVVLREKKTGFFFVSVQNNPKIISLFKQD